MMSIASMMSVSNLSTIGFLEDEEDDDYNYMYVYAMCVWCLDQVMWWIPRYLLSFYLSMYVCVGLVFAQYLHHR